MRLWPLSRSPDGLNFKHCIAPRTRSAQFRRCPQLQRERYKADMKLISNDVRCGTGATRRERPLHRFDAAAWHLLA